MLYIEFFKLRKLLFGFEMQRSHDPFSENQTSDLWLLM